MVQTLIDQFHIDINARGDHNNTPLFVAAICGKADVALFLLKKFVYDPSVKGQYGRSMLHAACSGGNASLV